MSDQFIIHTSQAKLLCIGDLDGIVDFRPGIFKKVLACPLLNKVCGCLFDSNRVGGGDNADIGNVRLERFVHAIAVVGNMRQEIEKYHLSPLPLQNSKAMFGNLFLEIDGTFVPGDFNGIKLAYGQAFSASDT